MADYGYNGYSQGSANQGTVKRLDEDKKKYKYRKMLKKHAKERAEIKSGKEAKESKSMEAGEKE